MTLDYKGYKGTIEFCEEDNVFFGKLLTSDLVSYESENLDDLKAAFEEAVDDYLETLKIISNGDL